jgi:hypothetical protein
LPKETLYCEHYQSRGPAVFASLNVGNSCLVRGKILIKNGGLVIQKATVKFLNIKNNTGEQRKESDTPPPSDKKRKIIERLSIK